MASPPNEPSQNMSVVSFKKGQIIQQKGELNHKVYLVKSGLLRSYQIDSKGKIHVFMFAPEGWVMADNIPPDRPCELIIDALEDSQVRVLEKLTDLANAKEQIRKLINRIEVLQRRTLMLMSATAIERYQHFIETYPSIVQRVPQKLIASYLGVTPEALSKAKGDVVKQQQAANR